MKKRISNIWAWIKRRRWQIAAVVAILVTVAAALNRVRNPRNEAERIAIQLSPVDGSKAEVVQYVKARLKNPDSFRHISTTFARPCKGDAVAVFTMQYSAENDFGATVHGRVFATCDIKTGKVLSVSGLK